MSESESAARRERLRAATSANKLFVLVAVGAVAWPLVFHYSGLAPAERLKGLTYPALSGYLYRQTPGQKPSHGIDFSQIHLSARHLNAGEPVYFKVLRGKWRRRWSSTYHPMVHWLYLPMAVIPFPIALALHNLGGMAIVLLSAALALRRAGSLWAFPSIAAAFGAAMFLSPTGLLHLERGQMDLFAAGSFICVIAMFGPRMVGWALAAALFATLKVSAWIFVGFYWIVAAPLWGLRDWRVWVLPAAIGLANLVFLSEVKEWIPAFMYVAENTSRAGPSFTRVLPNSLAHALPFVSTFLVAAVAWGVLFWRNQWQDPAARRQVLERISFPLAAVLAIQTIGATPVTHDYRLVALLGLLPALAIWCGREERLAAWLRYAVALGYAFVMVVAFRIPPFLHTLYVDVAWLLIWASVVLLVLTLYLPFRRLREAASPVRSLSPST
ncbi:MAG: hypothetical protein VX546_07235 [Myxococcota bacterium]|nr:hypothetical protein [Myxococcota bacterium]